QDIRSRGRHWRLNHHLPTRASVSAPFRIAAGKDLSRAGLALSSERLSHSIALAGSRPPVSPDLRPRSTLRRPRLFLAPRHTSQRPQTPLTWRAQAGSEPATRCSEGTCQELREVAWSRSIWPLAALIVAGRGSKSPWNCRRWLPFWLPRSRCLRLYLNQRRPRPPRWCMKWPPRDLSEFKQ